jgi:hypothetical protein
VLAESLSRRDIFAALKARRCYGTSGPRIDLDFTVEQQPMGSILKAQGRVQIQAAVKASAPVESLTLFQGKEPICVVQPAAFSERSGSRKIRLSWQGSRIRGRGRRVTWDGAIRLDGAALVSAQTFAFDAKTDGILRQSDREIEFKSSTTGDTDGIDLLLQQADQGTLVFDSPVGRCEVDLAALEAKKEFEFGGMGIRLCVERYPEQLTECAVHLSTAVDPPAGKTTPYFVKAVQADGHSAWASPIYVEREA